MNKLTSVKSAPPLSPSARITEQGRTGGPTSAPQVMDGVAKHTRSHDPHRILLPRAATITLISELLGRPGCLSGRTAQGCPQPFAERCREQVLRYALLEQDAEKLLRKRLTAKDAGLQPEAAVGKLTLREALVDVVNDYTTNGKKSLKDVQGKIDCTCIHSLVNTGR